MPVFREIQSHNDLQEVIRSAFDTDLDLGGAWGYSQALATVIKNSTASITQTEHILASMRAYLEMNMTLQKEARYGSINLTEKHRVSIDEESHQYHKVTYAITAMHEKDYEKFINEYKENYGKESFNMTQHFENRKEATLHREVIHWFEIPTLNQ